MAEQSLVDRHISEWAWFLIAAGAVLRFQGLDWDQGLMLNPDERNIATGAARLAFPDGLVPQFHAYNGLALYLPRLLAEAIAPWTNKIGSAPDAIVFAGRILSALYSTLALPVLWLIARRALRMEAALLVAGCAAVSPGLIQAAHFATTESGLVLCLVVVVWLSVLHITGSLSLQSYAILNGVMLGLGFGLKTSALALAICPVVAVAITTLSQRQLWPSLKAGAVTLFIFAALALATTPQLWANPQEYLATMKFESSVVSGAADVFWTYQFARATDGLFELSQLPWLVGPAIAPLGLAGLAAVMFGLFRRQSQSVSLAAAAAFALVYAAIVFCWHAKFVRYLTLLAPLLIIFAGYLISQLDTKSIRHCLMIAAGAITSITGLAQAAIYQTQDPRIAAWEWMLPRLRAGDQLVVEPADLGPPYHVPATTPITTTVLPLLEPSSREKIDRIGEILARADWLIVASRRHHRVLPRLHDRFPEMCRYYDALWSGRFGFEVVAKLTRRPLIPDALSPELQAEETFTVFDSPIVFVLANRGHLTSANLIDEIHANATGCSGPY